MHGPVGLCATTNHPASAASTGGVPPDGADGGGAQREGRAERDDIGRGAPEGPAVAAVRPTHAVPSAGARGAARAPTDSSAALAFTSGGSHN